MSTIGRKKVVLLVAGLVFIFIASAYAQDIKSRMRARLPVIVSLKAQGVVGENNQGYLAILKNAGEKEKVVTAENQDRRRIYTAIAKKQGTTPALVGKRRAIQIAEKADPGTMIQDESGQWRRK